jgi:uncharacterized protein YcbK (DUF882 family)
MSSTVKRLVRTRCLITSSSCLIVFVRNVTFPFVITSGYRSPQHSVEKDKLTKGRHTLGIAADIAVSNGYQRYKIVEKAIELGFKGIGVANSFVHVDLRNTDTPVMWTYS